MLHAVSECNTHPCHTQRRYKATPQPRLRPAIVTHAAARRHSRAAVIPQSGHRHARVKLSSELWAHATRADTAAKSELGLCQKRYYLVCSLQAAIVGGEQAEEDVLDHFEW
jgi:hypothetical protein